MFLAGTQLGGVLDMVTDRYVLFIIQHEFIHFLLDIMHVTYILFYSISTAGFLVMLSSLYPEFTLAAALLICLDIASHWFHVMR